MTEFRAGEFYRVDWSDKGCCCGGHNDCECVVFIRRECETFAEIAYVRVQGDICVGYVPYSALSEG